MASDWYFMDNDKVQGPISASQLQSLVHQGKITATTQVTRGTAGNWATASKVKGLLFTQPLSNSRATSNSPASAPARSSSPPRFVACPHCKHSMEVDAGADGQTFQCSQCNRPLVIPPGTSPIESAREKIVGQSLERLSDKVEEGVSSVIHAFISEQQDPAQVQEIYSKISQLLTKEETISYISIQNKPIINVRPDAIVLTNRRVIVYHSKLFGRVDFEDFIWRDLVDVRLTEGMLGATIHLETTHGKTVSLDYLPKPQARKVYATAQEMEERVREERRLRGMEETRAAAGGVIIQGGIPTAQGGQSVTTEDPVQKLKQLKDMLDAGLITQGEYEGKRQAILSRM